MNSPRGGKADTAWCGKSSDWPTIARKGVPFAMRSRFDLAYGDRTGVLQFLNANEPDTLLVDHYTTLLHISSLTWVYICIYRPRQLHHISLFNLRWSALTPCFAGCPTVLWPNCLVMTLVNDGAQGRLSSTAVGWRFLRALPLPS